MTLVVGILFALAALGSDAQTPISGEAVDSADFAERPWHQAVVWGRHPTPSLTLDQGLQAAQAQIDARRYGTARSLLLELVARGRVGGEPRVQTLLADVELRMGLFTQAARRFHAARLDNRSVGHGRLAVLEARAWTGAGDSARAVDAYRAARLQLPRIVGWLQLNEARLTADTAAAFGLLATLHAAPRAAAMRTRVDLRLAAGDTAGAFLEAVLGGDTPSAIRLALATGDTQRASALLYDQLERSPAAARGLVMDVLSANSPATSRERLLAARALQVAGERAAALRYAKEAARDSLAEAWLLVGDLEAQQEADGRAVQAYTRADELGAGGLARLRRAMAMRRIDPAAARTALVDAVEREAEAALVAQALLQLGALDGPSKEAESDAWYVELTRRFPRRAEASIARWHLVERHRDRGDTAGALRWLAAEAAQGRERPRAMFWQAKLTASSGDSGVARRLWSTLARTDSLGYYGTMARVRAGLPSLAFAPRVVAARDPAAHALFVRLDDLIDTGLVDNANAEVSWLLRSVTDSGPLLDYAEGLIERGYVPEGIRLGWRAARVVGLNDARVIRAIWPLPRPHAVRQEAQEFGLDPFVLAALVYAESRFDTAAVSEAGARGLTQLMPSTARGTARRLGIPWRRDWVELSDLNLHLGSSHLAGLQRAFDGELRLSLAAYNAGGGRVRRWLRRRPFNDPDAWVEEIPFAETRGYVRGVLRNLAVYRALYGPGRDAS